MAFRFNPMLPQGLSGRRPFTVRKSGGILGSLVAMLLGFGFVVIGSPLTAWYAESQHQAKDFATAQQVAASEQTDGYVAITGEAVADEELACPTGVKTDGSCVWVETETQRYESEEKRVCGSLSDNQTILQNLPDECDSDGTNCERCYQVAETDWNTISTDSDFASFTMGAYTVTPTDQVNFIGEEELPADTATQPVVGDERVNYTYYLASKVALVAGTTKAGTVTLPTDGKPFVISNLDYAGTLAALESQDATMKWILRIVSLVLMVVGMTMIASPLTAFTNVFRFIPFLGKRLDQGFDAVIGFVAGLIGVAAWLVLWGAVLLLKNIWLILIVLGVIAVIAVILIQRGKKATNSSAPTTPSATS